MMSAHLIGFAYGQRDLYAALGVSSTQSLLPSAMTGSGTSSPGGGTRFEGEGIGLPRGSSNA
jgi:hypothetical protein